MEATQEKKITPTTAFISNYAVWIAIGALTAFVLWEAFQPKKATRGRPKFD